MSLPFDQLMLGVELDREVAPQTVFRVWCSSASVWKRECLLKSASECLRVGEAS